MRIFQSGLAATLMNSNAFPDDMPIESKVSPVECRSAQAQIEGRNFDIRKTILKYDDVMASQRDVIYAERKRVLAGEDLRDEVVTFIDEVSHGVVTRQRSGNVDDWNLEGLPRDLRAIYPVSLTVDELVENVGGLGVPPAAYLVREFTSDAHLRYEEVEERIGADIMRQVERQVILQVVDAKWREHLYEMDYLRDGIGLRAMGQRDPLMEYQRESFQMFEALAGTIRETTRPGAVSCGEASTAAGRGRWHGRRREGSSHRHPPRRPRRPPDRPARVGTALSSGTGSPGAVSMSQMTFSGAEPRQRSGTVALRADGRAAPAGWRGPGRSAGRQDSRKGRAGRAADRVAAEPVRPRPPSTCPVVKAKASGATYPGTARNAPCPCGSGKKYKLCHGMDEA